MTTLLIQACHLDCSYYKKTLFYYAFCLEKILTLRNLRFNLTIFAILVSCAWRCKEAKTICVKKNVVSRKMEKIRMHCMPSFLGKLFQCHIKCWKEHKYKHTFSFLEGQFISHIVIFFSLLGVGHRDGNQDHKAKSKNGEGFHLSSLQWMKKSFETQR